MTTPDETVLLTDETLPDLFRRSDSSAISSQWWHTLLVRIELTLAVLAALAQVVSHPFGSVLATWLHLHIGGFDMATLALSADTVTSAVASALIPGILLALLIAVTTLRYFVRLDERWHDQRAVAEKTKSLAWRYCMRALPGDLQDPSRSDFAADKEFLQDMNALADEAKLLNLPPPSADVKQQQTSQTTMETLRKASDPATRRDAYVAGRLENQLNYFTNKAMLYHGRRNGLRRAMVGCYAIGILLAPFNGLGAMTTAAGALSSWLTGRQYEELYQSYGTMASKLQGLIGIARQYPLTEIASAQDWAHFVDGVEKLLEGERREWNRRASREILNSTGQD